MTHFYDIKVLRKIFYDLVAKGNYTTDIAKSIGCTPPTLTKVLNNQSILRASCCELLIKNYNVNPDYLYRGIEPMYIETIEPVK